VVQAGDSVPKTDHVVPIRGQILKVKRNVDARRSRQAGLHTDLSKYPLNSLALIQSAIISGARMLIYQAGMSSRLQQSQFPHSSTYAAALSGKLLQFQALWKVPDVVFLNSCTAVFMLFHFAPYNYTANFF
jgi:hypothetical protein